MEHNITLHSFHSDQKERKGKVDSVIKRYRSLQIIKWVKFQPKFLAIKILRKNMLHAHNLTIENCYYE